MFNILEFHECHWDSQRPYEGVQCFCVSKNLQMRSICLVSNIYMFFIWFKAKSFKSFLHDFHIKNIFLFQIIQEDNKIKIRASFKSFICNKFKKLLEIFFSYFSHQKNSFIVDETGRLQDPIESRFWEVHL